eukprot:859788_1
MTSRITPLCLLTLTNAQISYSTSSPTMQINEKDNISISTTTEQSLSHETNESWGVVIIAISIGVFFILVTVFLLTKIWTHARKQKKRSSKMVVKHTKSNSNMKMIIHRDTIQSDQILKSYPPSNAIVNDDLEKAKA